MGRHSSSRSRIKDVKHFHEGSHRQSRRDRAADQPRMPRAGRAHGRDFLRGRSRVAARAPSRRSVLRRARPGPRSYLNIPNIISTALITGCDAIHPGYGFLAENARFRGDLRRSRADLHRSETRRDRGDGRQGDGEARDARSRCRDDAGHRHSRIGRRGAARGRGDRLSGPAQSDRRRRRQGHARGRERPRDWNAPTPARRPKPKRASKTAAFTWKN